MNIHEFSRLADVSTATVSRAFHEPAKLRPETRTRILALAKEVGYYPSPSGRALKTGLHDVLGLVWPLEVEGPDAEFAQRILASLTRHLVARDKDLLLCPVNRDDLATLEHARRTFRRSRCDAWIVLYPRHHDFLISALEEVRCPVVCLMGSPAEPVSWKCVRLDQRSWIEEALQRLKAAGCRKVAFWGARSGEPDHEERREAFGQLAPRYFKNHGIGVSDSGDLDRRLENGSIDAIIGADDTAALFALRACQVLGLSVPRDVKIVGIDDSARAQFSDPPLSSYRQPLDEMVGCAVELALGQRQRSRIFSATFVPRQSLPG